MNRLQDSRVVDFNYFLELDLIFKKVPVVALLRDDALIERLFAARSATILLN